MKEYNVLIPIVAKAEVSVEAKDEEEAIEKAFEKVELEHVGEWDVYREVTEGNVYYGIIRKVEVFEM